MKKVNRREFIKTSAVVAAGVSLLPSGIALGRDDRKVRLGFIGVGLRGTSHLELALARKDVEVKAVCDIRKAATDNAVKLVTDAGQKKPAVYLNGEEDYRNLVTREDIDGVIISTPWVWHAPMAIAAMKAGKYAGVEVPAALTEEECWDLVHTSEETGMPCMILENVCYRRDVMAVYNMVRQGIFGELMHCHCGYQHDLRNIKFQPGAEFGEKGQGEAVWRTEHSIKRNGDLYPTHGAGPVAKMLDINTGNRFVTLTSMATKSRGLHNYVLAQGGEDHPNAKIKFALGDIVTTMIKCANGETVLISHDTNLPRPYSLNFRVQGTNGLWMDDFDSIYLEGVSPEPHRWESFEKYQEQYDHPLWKKYESDSEGAGHGGMDFFVLHAFIESIKRKVPTPIDVYDAAAWSVLVPLSEQSVAQGGAPMAIPDFTGGRWVWRKSDFALDDQY